MQALKKKSQDLAKLLKHLESHGFVRTGSDGAELLGFGPLGELVFHNLRNEWLHSTTTYREMNVFLHHTDSDRLGNNSHFDQDLNSAFSMAKYLSGDSPPFGVAYSRTFKEQDSSDPLYPRRHVELKQVIFEKPQVSKQYFYRHLQQRKRWWRKFSADPGRFAFGDITKPLESSVAEEAQILVTFPWGCHEVEKVRYCGSENLDKLPLADQNDFTVLYEKKRSLPHVIESYFNLDYGALTYMFDAYSERKSGRPVLRFHRKLSPYKYAFAAGSVSSAIAQELLDMSRMACLDLKKEGLPCLFPSPQELGKRALDAQLAKHDALGICYTVVFNEGSLKTGLCGLYNRETALQKMSRLNMMWLLVVVAAAGVNAMAFTGDTVFRCPPFSMTGLDGSCMRPQLSAVWPLIPVPDSESVGDVQPTGQSELTPITLLKITGNQKSVCQLNQHTDLNGVCRDSF